MEQEIAALEEQNTSHQEQVIVLQSTKDELQQHINTIEQEKAMLNEQLRRLQQSGGVGSADSEVSSLRDQLNQVTMDRDNIKRQMTSTEHYKSLLEDENATQKATIATLEAQVAAGKESHDGDGGLLQAQLASAEEAMKRTMEGSSAKDTTITDVNMRMLELQQTRGQLEKEVAEMREQKEKMLMENAQLREVATQPTKYQHAVEENKQLKRDNQELETALERAQTELQVFKENSMALKEQLDNTTDQATLDAITDKMSKYKGERDDTRAQVQALQEQLQSGGGGASGDVVNKMSRYQDDPSKTFPQKVKKLSTSGGVTRQPTKRTTKSIIKQVMTADGEESISCEPINLSTEVKKGQRVIVSRANSTECGTVRAVNVTIDVRSKGFIGVEMDLPSMCMMHKKCVVMLFSTGGTTDGQVKGIRHFKWLVILTI